MLIAKFKQFFLHSKFGRLVGGAYIIYLVVLMLGSAQLGLQLGAELKSIPENQRMDYISAFISEKL